MYCHICAAEAIFKSQMDKIKSPNQQPKRYTWNEEECPHQENKLNEKPATIS